MDDGPSSSRRLAHIHSSNNDEHEYRQDDLLSSMLILLLLQCWVIPDSCWVNRESPGGRRLLRNSTEILYLSAS